MADIYVQKDGQRLGPFPETRIRQGLDAGEFVPADLGWTNGKASWQPISELIDLDVTHPPPLFDPQPFSPKSIPVETGISVLPKVIVPPPLPPTPEQVSSPTPSSSKYSCKQCGAPYNPLSPTHAWGSGLCRRCYKAAPAKPTRETVFDRPISSRQNALKAVQATAILYTLLGITNIVMTWLGWLDSFFLGCVMLGASFMLWLWHSRIAATILFLIPILCTVYVLLIGEWRAILDAGYWNLLTGLQVILAWKGMVASFKLHKEFADTQLPVETTGSATSN